MNNLSKARGNSEHATVQNKKDGREPLIENEELTFRKSFKVQAAFDGSLFQNSR